MHPFYFGTTQRPLFGVYHAAEGRGSKAAGVVVCPPTGHEYIRSYRALRNLSVLLAKAGCHVLRFDYFGTGDSAGDVCEARLAEWLANVEAAAEELKDAAGLSRVSLLGLRIGASLVAMAAGERTDLDKLLLWDPVLRGAEYLEATAAVQSAWLKTRPQLRLPAEDSATELLGFALPEGLRKDLASVDLWRVAGLRAKRVTVVASDVTPEVEKWSAHLASAGMRACYRHAASGDLGWVHPDAVHMAFLPHQALLQMIVSDMCGESR